MKVVGLSADSQVQNYLQEAYGVECVANEKGIPVFKKEETYFLGGFKWLYSLVLDADLDTVGAVIDNFCARRRACISIVSVAGGGAVSYITCSMRGA